MKILRIIGIFWILIFVGGASLVSYWVLFRLDREVLNGELAYGQESLIAVLLSGFIALLFLLLSRENRVEVIYVEQDTQRRNAAGSEEHSENNLRSQGSQLSVREIENLMIRLQGNKKKLLDESLSQICKQVEASSGVIYLQRQEEGQAFYEMVTTYAYYHVQDEVQRYELGQGLIGQVAKNGESIILGEIPEGYMEAVSGLGKSSPGALMILPIINEQKEVWGVLEIASFGNFTEPEQQYLKEVALLLAKEMETSEYQNLDF